MVANVLPSARAACLKDTSIKYLLSKKLVLTVGYRLEKKSPKSSANLVFFFLYDYRVESLSNFIRSRGSSMILFTATLEPTPSDFLFIRRVLSVSLTP